MSELLPEVWMSEEEETLMFRSVLMMPKKRAGPITDMLWSVFCKLCGHYIVEVPPGVVVVHGNDHQVCPGL